MALVEQPYRVAGRRSPAPARQLDAAWVAVVAALRDGSLQGVPLVTGGRSSGARVACRTAADTRSRECCAWPSRFTRPDVRRRAAWTSSTRCRCRCSSSRGRAIRSGCRRRVLGRTVVTSARQPQPDRRPRGGARRGARLVTRPGTLIGVCQRIGHGGASALAPANTLASFDAAREIGIDMVEFDVRAWDGELVLAHTVAARAPRGQRPAARRTGPSGRPALSRRGAERGRQARRVRGGAARAAARRPRCSSEP